MKKLVGVGLSGGIDSSFAAYVLKEQGWDVIGFTLKFYPEENRCCDLESLYQAKRLCHRLGIPHYVFDVKDLFQDKIINYFIDSYIRGLTPNPCVLCNRLIKFGYFFKKLHTLGIEYIATGHYARIENIGNSLLLRKAKDEKKSQEYFLSLIDPAILKNIVLPLGNYTKETVKKISLKKKIMFKERKESQDICFVKDKSYHKFIQERLKSSSQFAGNIYHINGRLLGRHKGIHLFTTGQREGIGVSWKEPLYVLLIDENNKSIIVGEKKYLYCDKFTVSSINWFIPVKELYKFKHSLPDENMNDYTTNGGDKIINDIKVKVRYNSPDYLCSIEFKDNKLNVYLKRKIESVTPGQVAAFYYNDFLLGSGIIEKNFM